MQDTFSLYTFQYEVRKSNHLTAIVWLRPMDLLLFYVTIVHHILVSHLTSRPCSSIGAFSRLNTRPIHTSVAYIAAAELRLNRLNSLNSNELHGLHNDDHFLQIA